MDAPDDFIVVVDIYEIIRIGIIVIVVHGDLRKKKKSQKRRGFRNPLKASYFSLNRKFGGTFVKIPVGI
jgi:hypothetical protein